MSKTVKQRRIFKKSSASSSEWVIFLKSPTPANQRATFTIQKRPRKNSSAKGYQTVHSETLDSINKSYREKKLTFEAAKALAQELVASMRGTTAILHHAGNMKFLEAYWESEYADRDLVDQNEAKQRLTRAIEALGHYSIFEASRAEMQAEVDQRYQGNTQRRIISTLNQLLPHANRDFKLRRAREELKKVSYMTPKELDMVLSQIEEPQLKLIFEVAFGTGLRLGEIFAIEPKDVKKKSLSVSRQVDRAHKIRATKNRRSREVYVIPEFMKGVREWAGLPFEEKMKWRDVIFSLLTRKFTKGRFKFHDLRHSYAVYLVSKGAGLTLVKDSLGNSLAVAEKYYAGFILTPESIDLLDSIITKNS